MTKSPTKKVFGNNKLSKPFEWNPQPKQEAANSFSEKTFFFCLTNSKEKDSPGRTWRIYPFFEESLPLSFDMLSGSYPAMCMAVECVIGHPVWMSLVVCMSLPAYQLMYSIPLSNHQRTVLSVTWYWGQSCSV